MHFFSPSSPEQVFDLLDEFGPGAVILAGGTDLLVKIRRTGSWPKALIWLGKLGGGGVCENNGNIIIGAMATAALLERRLVSQIPLLAVGAGQIGGAQIRNMATVAGNLANGSPAADMALCLLTLDAQVLLMSKTNRRSLPISDFFRGPGRTALQLNEIIYAISVPLPEPEMTQWFRKVGPRSRHFISRVAVAGTFRSYPEGGFAVRIGLGAVSPTPVRATAAESYLNSIDVPGEEEILTASLIASEEDCSPIDDFRSSAGYRRKVVKNLVRQFLQQGKN